MRRIFMIVALVLGVVTAQAQGVKVTSRYKPLSYDAIMAQAQAATNAHIQAENQVYAWLEKVNEYYSKGEYANAELYLNRCIQLNARWNNNLIDNNVLLNDKKQIDEAKKKASSQSSNNNYNQHPGYNNNQNSSNNYRDDNSEWKKAFMAYVEAAYSTFNIQKYAQAREQLNKAWEIYKRYNFSLTGEESNYYNTIDRKLVQVENSGSNNNSQNTNQPANTEQDINEQNCFEIMQKLVNQFEFEKTKADSLRFYEVRSTSSSEKTRLKNECDEMEHKAELTKIEYLKAFAIAEYKCNTMIKKEENVFIANVNLGWIYFSKAIVVNVERWFSEEDKSLVQEFGDEERGLLSKSLQYYEKAHELDGANNDIYKRMINVRKLLGLDDYNPTFTISSNDVVRRYPEFQELDDDHIVIKRVIISDNHTIVEFSSINKRKDGSYFSWMTIDKNTYLNVGGQKYYLTKAEGIAISPNVTYYYNQDQTKDFALYFPAIPKTTETMDLIEPGASDWKFYGIKLK